MASSSSAAGAPAAPPTLVDSLFQRSLDDLIRSLRSNPAAEPLTVTRALDDIHREIRSTDPDTKATALEKLTYLSSLHHLDPSWAAFHSLELLPSPNPHQKRLAYLAASLSFHPSTDVLLLATNQLRKDLASPLDPVASLALEFLSSAAASPGLARDLAPEIHNLLASSRTPVRKKATAAILRVFVQYPDAVRVSFKRLVENLECADQRIVSAAIGVFCELSAGDPRAYLPLAPEFYRILVDCKNNWVLIKVLKIFARLAPLEPRLAKRVVEPVCEHMTKSTAKSLIFECIRTVLVSLDEYEHAVRLAVLKMRDFLASEDDPNLRYLGLHALSMLKPMHSWAVEENREVVVKSLSDPDRNIQQEALHLVMSLVSDDNVVEISDLLVKQAMKSDPMFCNDILGAILSTCGRNFYELVVDFEWYAALLGDMSRVPHCAVGEEIERQIVDIGLRVKDVRPELVHVARGLLIDPALLGYPFLYRILSAAAWIAGEYVEFSRNPTELVEALLQPRTSLLPALVRSVYIQAVFKIIVFCYSSYLEGVEVGQLLSQKESVAEKQSAQAPGNPCSETLGIESKDDMTTNQMAESLLVQPVISDPFTYKSIESMLNLIKAALSPLSECDEVEVQERARNVIGLICTLQELQSCDLDKEIPDNLTSIFEFVKLMQDAVSEELGPVPVNAQEKVTVPDGFALVETLADIGTVLSDDSIELVTFPAFSLRIRHPGDKKEESEPLAESSSSLIAEHRKRHGLYYIPTEKDENETEPCEYPRANDPLNQGNIAGDATDALFKLTQKSLATRKPKPVKPRPVVIKLDEESSAPRSLVKVIEPKDDLLSDKVHNILLVNEDEHVLSKKKSSGKSSHRRDSSRNAESTFHSKKSMGDVDHGSSKSRHDSHGKDKHKGNDNTNKTEGTSIKKSHESSRHHGRHKHKQRRDGSSKEVVSQAPVIQDFLL